MVAGDGSSRLDTVRALAGALFTPSSTGQAIKCLLLQLKDQGITSWIKILIPVTDYR